MLKPRLLLQRCLSTSTSLSQFEASYDHAAVETVQKERWEAAKQFRANPRGKNEGFSIVLPPPNVTGFLHVGHALCFSLQDTLARFERMRGKDVMWEPGTDHAGIATQVVVQKMLQKEGTSGEEIGRDKFISRVWEWREQSGGQIYSQLKMLGASLDWDKPKFTMDPDVSDTVRAVFVELYGQGLIFRSERLVNWDPVLQTAVSDLEVEQRHVDGHMWNIQYPVEGSNEKLVIATTRPETMLGDVAVAVNPKDPRYASLIGKYCIVPIVNRRVPIIGDEHIDLQMGTGAMKVTPAHDPNDFEIGKRHQLDAISMLDEQGRVTSDYPQYAGMPWDKARAAIVQDLEKQGLLAGITKHKMTLPIADRSGAVVQPRLTKQWFFNVTSIAQNCLEAVRTKKTTFSPPHWENFFSEWLEHIQPWCISRQIWWGHRIPAYYTQDGRMYVAESEAAAKQQAAKDLNTTPENIVLTQDSDVLDTWFSSGLWPLVVAGWRKNDEESQLRVAKYLPAKVVITAFDIIFFWVARMMMFSLHFTQQVPFERVIIHPLLRDANGQKMSKSKGNVVDPLLLIHSHGADALRHSLVSDCSPACEIRIDAKRVGNSRGFAVKLWNACRLLSMRSLLLSSHDDVDQLPSWGLRQMTNIQNQWAVEQTHAAINTVTTSFENARFDEGCNVVYRLLWNVLCDWQVEYVKLLHDKTNNSNNNNNNNNNNNLHDHHYESKMTINWMLYVGLRLLHPVMPFITEHLWTKLGFTRIHQLVCSSPWPTTPEDYQQQDAEAMQYAIKVITDIRTQLLNTNTNTTKLAVKLWAPLDIKQFPREIATQIVEVVSLHCHLSSIQRYGNSEDMQPANKQKIVTFSVDCIAFGLDGVNCQTISAEDVERITKKLAKLEKQLQIVTGQLNNENFLKCAKKEAVEAARKQQTVLQEEMADLKQTLEKANQQKN